MGLRFPLKAALDITHVNQGSTSVAGGWAYPFKIDQDCDGVVVRMDASVVAGGMSAIFQTSDDGGTTYFDVARTSIVSNAGATTDQTHPQWLAIPAFGTGYRTGVTLSSSVLTASVGDCSPSTLSNQQVTGLPILGQQNRIFLISTGNATSISTRVRVYENHQSKI